MEQFGQTNKNKIIEPYITFHSAKDRRPGYSGFIWERPVMQKYLPFTTFQRGKERLDIFWLYVDTE